MKHERTSLSVLDFIKHYGKDYSLYASSPLLIIVYIFPKILNSQTIY
jgi:hypothetical protein